MSRFVRTLIIATILGAGVFWGGGSAALSSGSVPPQEIVPGLEPIRGSRAYEQYSLRQKNDFSRLLYLIDRLGTVDAAVIYDGYQYDMRFVSAVSKWFLYRFYKNQTPEEWVLQWCHRSIPGNSLIWVRFPDGTRQQSRDVLLAELRNLAVAEAEEITADPA